MADLPDKATLRRAALARRDALAPALRATASLAIRERALTLPELAANVPVAAYWPIRSEVDCRPLMSVLVERSHQLALPIVSGPSLSFRAWRPGDPLEAAGFGTMGPSATAPEVRPRVLIVPLAAFDQARHRIGYGKGHYDRAIAQLADGGVTTIGLAFDCQAVDEVPAEGHDRRLDVIVTETATLAASGHRK